jgi:hypothetical protein
MMDHEFWKREEPVPEIETREYYSPNVGAPVGIAAVGLAVVGLAVVGAV